MDKRTFLKTSTVLAGGALLSRLESCTPDVKQEHLKNWAGNLEFSTGNVYYPKTLKEVQELVKKYKKLRPLGSRHSFNTIADSAENLICSTSMNKVVSLDAAASTVTVEAGMRYGELRLTCRKKGLHYIILHHFRISPLRVPWLLPRMGSGIKNGNLSTGVSAIEFVNASGEVINLSKKKDGDIFNGAVVGLGALGIVTKLTLDLLPEFQYESRLFTETCP
jgi:xylitol oxidase